MTDPKYDTNTKKTPHQWAPLPGPKYVSEVRNNSTGEVSKGYGQTKEEARKRAWDKVK